MREDGPNCMEGPIRGTNSWWRGLDPEQKPDQPPANAARNKTITKDETGIRRELVERIRCEIAAGTYDTQEKWDAALDRMLERLDTD
jgi:hypothetical protein